MTIDIQLLNENTNFQPGDQLEAEIHWKAKASARSICWDLLWHTAGRGTEDMEIVQSGSFDPEPNNGSSRLSLQLPEFPYSYSGKLLSILWVLEARIEPNGSVAKERLVIAPGAVEICPEEPSSGNSK